jgi:hypothetical protein
MNNHEFMNYDYNEAVDFEGIMPEAAEKIGVIGGSDIIVEAHGHLANGMDALETAVWILCIVEKISLYFLGVINCIKFILPKVSRKIICVGCIGVVSVLRSFISANLERFNFMSYTPLVVGLYVVPVLILPIALIIYLKKVKPYEKNIPDM